MAKFFKAAWGSVELWIASITTDKGRKLAVHEYARGNVPDVQNRGAVPQYARCELLFDDLEGLAQENGEDRLNSLVALANEGKPQLFVHPVEGTYLAEIEELQYKVDEHGVITATCSFLATEDVGAVVVDPLGASLDIDPASLAAIVADLEGAQAAAGITDSQVPAAATSMSSFLQQASSARDKLVQVSQLSDMIGQEINDYQLAADTALWPVMKAYVMLGQAVSAAADVASGDTGDLMTLRVQQPTSLRRLMSDLYGAADAADFYDQALSLNDIPTPARIPAGTQLALPQPKKKAA